MLTRRELIQTAGLLPLTASIPQRDSFWVFGLLKPQSLIVRGLKNARLHCASGRELAILEPQTKFKLERGARAVEISGPDAQAVPFVLEIPGVIRREYLGRLTVNWNGAELVPIVTMQREIAVASIVGAELPIGGSARETLMAQAVLARSFLAGTPAPRHACAFFCDTTHCQFLRSPSDESRRAALRTEGILLGADKTVVAAQYSAACGGTTRHGRRDGFEYQSVSCQTCRQLHLARRGHGWGLCQEGARELGKGGMRWSGILATYFPTASFLFKQRA